MIRLDRLLANLGYGTRKDALLLIKQGRITVDGSRKGVTAKLKVEHSQVALDGEPLDPDFGLVAMLNKPSGHACSHDDRPPLVYSLLPERWHFRKPQVNSIGRLDRDTTGLVLFTDDGQLIHRLTAPRSRCPKIYHLETESPLKSRALEAFRRGGLILEPGEKPLLPVEIEELRRCHYAFTLREGRRHQIKRMVKAAGGWLKSLHRQQFAGLELGGLEEGEFRLLEPEERRELCLFSSNESNQEE